MDATWQLTTSPTKLAKLGEELRRYFRKRVPQTADAEDLLGRLWLIAGRLFRRQSSPRYYTFKIARTLVADFWDNARRRGFSCANDEDFADIPEVNERLLSTGDELDRAIFDRYLFEQVEQGLALVPKDYREALELQLMGYTNFEIKETLGIHYHTVRSRLSKGKKKLLTLLAHVRAEAEG